MFPSFKSLSHSSTTPNQFTHTLKQLDGSTFKIFVKPEYGLGPYDLANLMRCCKALFESLKSNGLWQPYLDSLLTVIPHYWQLQTKPEMEAMELWLLNKQGSVLKTSWDYKIADDSAYQTINKLMELLVDHPLVKLAWDATKSSTWAKKHLDVTDTGYELSIPLPLSAYAQHHVTDIFHYLVPQIAIAILNLLATFKSIQVTDGEGKGEYPMSMFFIALIENCIRDAYGQELLDLLIPLCLDQLTRYTLLVEQNWTKLFEKLLQLKSLPTTKELSQLIIKTLAAGDLITAQYADIKKLVFKFKLTSVLDYLDKHCDSEQLIKISKLGFEFGWSENAEEALSLDVELFNLWKNLAIKCKQADFLTPNVALLIELANSYPSLACHLVQSLSGESQQQFYNVILRAKHPIYLHNPAGLCTHYLQHMKNDGSTKAAEYAIRLIACIIKSKQELDAKLWEGLITHENPDLQQQIQREFLRISLKQPGVQTEAVATISYRLIPIFILPFLNRMASKEKTEVLTMVVSFYIVNQGPIHELNPNVGLDVEEKSELLQHFNKSLNIKLDDTQGRWLRDFALSGDPITDAQSIDFIFRITVRPSLTHPLGFVFTDVQQECSSKVQLCQTVNNLCLELTWYIKSKELEVCNMNRLFIPTRESVGNNHMHRLSDTYVSLLAKAIASLQGQCNALLSKIEVLSPVSYIPFAELFKETCDQQPRFKDALFPSSLLQKLEELFCKELPEAQQRLIDSAPTCSM